MAQSIQYRKVNQNEYAVIVDGERVALTYRNGRKNNCPWVVEMDGGRWSAGTREQAGEQILRRLERKAQDLPPVDGDEVVRSESGRTVVVTRRIDPSFDVVGNRYRIHILADPDDVGPLYFRTDPSDVDVERGYTIGYVHNERYKGLTALQVALEQVETEHHRNTGAWAWDGKDRDLAVEAARAAIRLADQATGV